MSSRSDAWLRHAPETAPMFARVMVGLFGSLPLAACGAALVAVVSGSTPDVAAASLFALLGLSIAVLAPGTALAWRRQLIATGVTLLGLALAAFTFGTVAQGLGVIPPVLLLLAGTVGVTATLFGLYEPAPVALMEPPAPTVFDSPDTTEIFEIPSTVSDPSKRSWDPLPAARQTSRHRKFLQAALSAAACVLLLALWWRLPVNRQQPPTAMAAAPAAAEIPATPTPAPPADPIAVPAEASPAPQRPVVAASTARRECMAQIESVNLFQKLAHEAATRVDYDLVVEAQKTRLLSQKLIGPRTLGIIAAQAWTNRERPDQPATWWSRQYQRCEAQRATGASYIVRSN